MRMLIQTFLHHCTQHVFHYDWDTIPLICLVQVFKSNFIIDAFISMSIRTFPQRLSKLDIIMIKYIRGMTKLQVMRTFQLTSSSLGTKREVHI